MRIISGSAGSIPLQVPRSLTRPTTDRVRESLFAVLGDLVVGAAFAGEANVGAAYVIPGPRVGDGSTDDARAASA